ncbi:hypothetical protein D3C87_419980 [compost metagenome]
MKRQNKVAAFTIVEAIVSMAVTGIILAIIFVIFSITSERLLDFKKQNEAITDLNRLSYTINKAIFESEDMELVNNEELVFKGYYGNEIYYRLTKDYLICEREDYTDTFHLETKHIRVDILPSTSKNEEYQRLTWQLLIDKNKINLNFYKKIYADKLLNSAKENEF